MRHKQIAIQVAATATILSFVSLPAFAFTRHPATPAEIQQTDDLNAKSLDNARNTNANQQPVADSVTASTATGPQTSLASLAVVPSAIGNATVTSQTGEAVGIVQKVIAGPDGKPAMVNVALTANQKVVAIAAQELSYDASKNILVASLTTEQIRSLPAAVS